jgi:hypothetical protein
LPVLKPTPSPGGGWHYELDADRAQLLKIQLLGNGTPTGRNSKCRTVFGGESLKEPVVP